MTTEDITVLLTQYFNTSSESFVSVAIFYETCQIVLQISVELYFEAQSNLFLILHTKKNKKIRFQYDYQYRFINYVTFYDGMLQPLYYHVEANVTDGINEIHQMMEDMVELGNIWLEVNTECVILYQFNIFRKLRGLLTIT